MWEIIGEAALDAVQDTVKLIPFLFLTYVVMEWLEHKTEEKTKQVVLKAGRLGPLFGGLLGVVPQCGFSAAAGSLYAGGVISIGTLLAIWLSTSDEMLPIFLSSDKASFALLGKVLLIKVVVAVAVGFLVDTVRRMCIARGWIHHRKMLPDGSKEELLKEEPGTEHIKDVCEQEQCHCEKKSVWKSAIRHTMQVAGFLLVISLILNIVLELVGTDFLSDSILANPFVGPLLGGLIGLIPNCAASVVLTELYLEGVMSGGTMLSGLLVGAGVGLLVLFRTNKSKKDNLLILGMLYVSGVVCGMLLGLIPGLV